ncbi:MAG: hypothetical protein IT379_39670 [Deltaproteobacteria bacterium]|nr:hypothetical protein [Deltaproteobacteria bacterium]
MNRDDNWKRRVGYFVAIAFVIACGTDRGMMAIVGEGMMDAGSVLRDASRSDAAAQPVTGCSQWEFTTWNTYRLCDPNPNFEAGATCEVPAGWEPFGGSDGTAVWLRRCLAP